MHDFRKIIAWQRGMDLAEQVYTATINFPPEEKYGLTIQISRAVSSIPQNIAEGAGRRTNPDFLRFLHIALGSAYELETSLLLACRLKLAKDADMKPVLEATTHIQKLIWKFGESLQKRDKPPE
jgi:four helix bundle protein